MELPFPPWLLWSAVGMATAVAVTVVAVGLGRLGRRPPVAPDLDYLPPASSAKIPIPSGKAAKPAPFMPPPTPLAADPTTDEHRANFRRAGNPVLILVADPDDPRRPFQAWVVDRSRQGLRLAAQKAVEIDRVYNVRPVNAPPAAPWTPL